jgi:hypothetical protein
MGIGRLEFIALVLLVPSLTACEQVRRAKECRRLSKLVNPALQSIDMERTKYDDAPAYGRIAGTYQALATELAGQRYKSKRLGDAVAEYAKLLGEASTDARSYAEALATKDAGKTALARAAAGRTTKRENAALLRIEGACVAR